MVSNIWIASADNDISLVKQYITLGQFTPNSKDPNGYTPIHAASSYGHIELLKYLIVENDGNINIQDNEGDTPLHYVESLPVAKFLIETLNADFKIKNNDGMNAQQYIEDNDEFLDISDYLKSLTHEKMEKEEVEDEDDSESDLLLSLPKPGSNDLQGHEIKYSLQSESDLIGDESLSNEELKIRREKIEKILNSNDPESELRELVQNAVHEGITKYKDQLDDNDENSQSIKRRKE